MNKKENEMLRVIQDDGVNAEDYINVYTSNKETTFRKGMYVKIFTENKNRMWIGQLITSNSNMCPAISKQTDQTMLAALEDGESKQDVLDGFGNSLFFKVKLLKMCYVFQENGKTYYDFEPINCRPSFGSKLCVLEPDEIIELLKVPKYVENEKTSNALGYCATVSNLPLCLTEREFHTHILVSGTTGSGKSNVNGHIVRIAQDLKKPVIIHDAKPDFEQIEFLNSESFSFQKSKRKREKESFYKYKEIGMKKVFKIGFYGIHNLIENSSSYYDAFIYYSPSDFTPEEFVKLFFYSEGDENQEEEFLSILRSFYEDINTGKIIDKYNHLELMKLIETSIVEKESKKTDMVGSGYDEVLLAVSKIHQATRKTMLQKLNRRLHQYPWLVAVSKEPNWLPSKSYNSVVTKMMGVSLLSSKVTDDKSKNRVKNYYKNMVETTYKERSKKDRNKILKAEIVTYIKNIMMECEKEGVSPIFVIDYNFKNADVTYSFIVNKLLKDIQSLQDSDEYSKNGVVQVVDEAHRLFSGLSKNFKEELEFSLGKVIKEGRVKKHSLVLSLQNASEVPDTALNNFGTKISLRQQSDREARVSTQGMGETAYKDIMGLSPGQFLIKYPSGEFTFMGFGFMSPFQLRVE